MSQNIVLRRTFSLKWEEVTGESCIVISFMVKLYSDELMVCTLHRILG